MLRIFSATAIVLLATSALAGQKPNPPQIQYAAPINRGLVGAWLMTEGGGTTLYDASGHGHNGTLIGGTVWTTGRQGPALALNGSTQYVDIPVAGAALIPAGSTGFSLSGWAYIKSFTSYPAVVGSTVPTGNFGGWQINTKSGGTFAFAANINNHWWETDSNSGFATNKWYHLVGVFDGVALRPYINNSAPVSFSISGSLAYQSSTADVKLGKNDGASSFLNGLIDDIRIWNRALSAAEVAYLYRATYDEFRPSLRPELLSFQSGAPAFINRPLAKPIFTLPGGFLSLAGAAWYYRRRHRAANDNLHRKEAA